MLSVTKMESQKFNEMSLRVFGGRAMHHSEKLQQQMSMTLGTQSSAQF